MREIKFRVWRCTDYDAHNISVGKMEYNIGAGPRGLILTPEGRPMISNSGAPTILMQYTGLKDKNGREIYEGDVVRLDPYDSVYVVSIEGGETTLLYPDTGGPVAAWDNGDHYCYSLGCVPRMIVEVVGNTHENPELIPLENTP